MAMAVKRVRRRPRRSASAAVGSEPRDDSRISASAMPIVVAGRPSCSSASSPTTSPNSTATSPMIVVTPNCAIPEATDSTDTLSTGALSHSGRHHGCRVAS